jgi:glutamyl-tRNA reductase
VDRLVLIGVSHRRGGAAALEAWQSHYPPEALDALCTKGFHEWVPIITCNRWDLLVSLSGEVSPEEARQHLALPGQSVRPYAYVGDGALEQLTRIACSLDSLNPGEDQIMAQVREAFASAKERGTTGPSTSFAFHTALRIAKRVRREIALAPVNTSLFSLAKPTLERLLPEQPLIAVLGAGEMGTIAAKTMATHPQAQLLIVNRDPVRAQGLARHLKARSMTLQAFLQDPPKTDALICATPVKDLVGEALLRRTQPRVVVDLGIPRNVAADAAKRLNITVLDIDTLQVAGQERRNERMSRLAEAERLVGEELELAIAEWTERQLGPSIKRLRDWYLETIGDALPAEEAMRLAHKFAHVPIKGLRAVAREHGLDAARTFLMETGLTE